MFLTGSFPAGSIYYAVVDCRYCNAREYLKGEKILGGTKMPLDLGVVEQKKSELKAVSVLEERRKLIAILREWQSRAIKESKPFCETCAVADYKNSDLKDFKHYQEILAPEAGVSVKELIEENSKSIRYGTVLGTHTSYACNKNHRTVFFRKAALAEKSK